MKRLYSGFEELSDDAAMLGSALEVCLISAVWLREKNDRGDGGHFVLRYKGPRDASQSDGFKGSTRG